MNKVYNNPTPHAASAFDVRNSAILNNDVPSEEEFNLKENTRLIHLRPSKPNTVLKQNKTPLQNQFIRLLRENNLWYSITYNAVSVGSPFRRCTLRFKQGGEVGISIHEPLFFKAMMSTATIFCYELPCVLKRMVQVGLLPEKESAKIKMITFPTRAKQEFATLIKVRKKGEPKVFPEKGIAFR